MNKETLTQLGTLSRIAGTVYDVMASEHFENKATMQKYNLILKVKKQLEEQSRGFLKSTIPYNKWAEYLIHFYQAQSFKELTTNLLKIKK